MNSRTAALLIWFLFSTFPLRADPENILVDKYTFIRPKAWKWKAPGESWSALSRFQISKDDAASPTEVRFYLIPADKSDVQKRVLSNFTKQVEYHEERVTVGDIVITYCTATGTAVDKETKDKPRPDHQFTAVLLAADTTGKNVFIRLFGPRQVAEPALPKFKQMIEQAVRDTQ